MTRQRPTLTLARWVTDPAAAVPGQPAYMLDRGAARAHWSGIGVVLPDGDVAQARLRLAAGARQVLLADAALSDAAVIRAAVAEFGPARVGAWLPVERAAVSWALDTQSNGDFRCMVPSNPQARWEVLGSDLRHTGIEATRCIEQLARQGVATVLVSVDMGDERDLDLCAGWVERFGALLWFSPLGASASGDLADWVEFGQVRQLVLSAGAAGHAQAERLTQRFGSLCAAAALAA